MSESHFVKSGKKCLCVRLVLEYTYTRIFQKARDRKIRPWLQKIEEIAENLVVS